MIKQYVGSFTEKDIKEGKDKKEVERLQQIFPKLKYVLTKIVGQNLKIWISDNF